MATVTELLDRASRITSLRATGAERTMALAALNDAYGRSVMDAECSLSTYTYTFVASSDDYALTTICSEQPVRLYHVALTQQGDSTPLRQVSHMELLDMREAQDAIGTPGYYATIGFERIAFYPNPAVGDQVRTWYLDEVPTLVESGAVAGQETTPSKLPAQYHYSVLLPALVVDMLDKDQRQAEAQYWQQRYEQGLARMIEHIGQMGGEANRAFLSKPTKIYRYNDQRSRWM